MKWISKFQLFLFDFDGLLVNSEHIHFQAYINMCARRGVQLDWSFLKYCSIAHTRAEALREALLSEHPELFDNETLWSSLYKEKKEEYLKLLNTGKVELMPGVDLLLHTLQEKDISSCVVTNSPREQIDIIQAFLPILKVIPHWITREQYTEPKPHPECYLKAIEKFAKKGDQIIGFEDSLRGLNALIKTPAVPVLICQESHPHISSVLEMSNVSYFPSFEAIDEKAFG